MVQNPFEVVIRLEDEATAKPWGWCVRLAGGAATAGTAENYKKACSSAIETVAAMLANLSGRMVAEASR